MYHAETSYKLLIINHAMLKKERNLDFILLSLLMHATNFIEESV
jgi:hypothetical protein